MKRALAIIKRVRNCNPNLPMFLMLDDGTSSNANDAHRFATLAAVSTRLHDIYTRESVDPSCTQIPLYEIVELVYDRVPSTKRDDEVIDHTQLVWRYQDGREFPVGENRTRCILVKPRHLYAWRLAK